MKLMCALGLCLLRPSLASAQAAPPPRPSREAILAVGRDVIKQARFCTFITVGVVIIRVSPIRLELVSVDRGRAGDPKTWLPLTVTFP